MRLGSNLSQIAEKALWAWASKIFILAIPIQNRYALLLTVWPVSGVTVSLCARYRAKHFTHVMPFSCHSNPKINILTQSSQSSRKLSEVQSYFQRGTATWEGFYLSYCSLGPCLAQQSLSHRQPNCREWPAGALPWGHPEGRLAHLPLWGSRHSTTCHSSRDQLSAALSPGQNCLPAAPLQPSTQAWHSISL